MADKPACIIARRIIVIRAQMICSAIPKISGGINIEKPNFCATTLIAVSDHRDRILRHQHLVIPAAAWIYVRCEGINDGDWLQRAIPDCDGKKASTPQHHQVIAMKL